MRAMILAAGRGERLRPLTDHCPKPLIAVGGKPLLVHHIEKLRAAGITELVVNSAWLSDKIVSYLEDGSAFGVHITHSIEGPGGLETAGGIRKALPLLGDDVFIVVNGDTYIDGDYRQFVTAAAALPAAMQGCLFLTPNPPHHPQGDFSLGPRSAIIKGGDFTFSGAAVYRVSAFAHLPVGRLPLRPVFDELSAAGNLQGRILQGAWFDVGTAERLNDVNAYIAAMNAGA